MFCRKSLWASSRGAASSFACCSPTTLDSDRRRLTCCRSELYPVVVVVVVLLFPLEAGPVIISTAEARNAHSVRRLLLPLLFSVGSSAAAARAHGEHGAGKAAADRPNFPGTSSNGSSNSSDHVLTSNCPCQTARACPCDGSVDRSTLPSCWTGSSTTDTAAARRTAAEGQRAEAVVRQGSRRCSCRARHRPPPSPPVECSRLRWHWSRRPRRGSECAGGSAAWWSATARSRCRRRSGSRQRLAPPGSRRWRKCST